MPPSRRDNDPTGGACIIKNQPLRSGQWCEVTDLKGFVRFLTIGILATMACYKGYMR